VSATASTERSGVRTPAPASAELAVSVHNLHKTFRLPRERVHTLKERVLHPFRARHFDTLHAVQDVTVDIPPGEFFGIVGRNGSGKSTLLKCLAGIYAVDEGDVSINGRLSPFIELGVGFNMDLTARDNVIINGIMLGLSRKQARERFPHVIEFAELEEFTELKLKNYSSGMLVRLAFATAIQVDADILLIDEVLAVGDAAFQQKCFDEFGRLHKEGRTILLVTHDMGAVQRFCDRAMLLERGNVFDIGDPSSIARQYNQLNFDRTRAAAPQGGRAAELLPGGGVAEVLNAWFESADGEVTVTASQGERCYVRMDVRFLVEVENPMFSITLRNETGNVAFATSTNVHASETGRFDAGSTASIRVGFENWLAPGRYHLVATAARAGFGADAYDTHTRASIIVVADRPGGGLADLPNTLEIERN
jgi:ABC-type polysaccharide/polyol phosphate transport system ATPase subunit